MAIDPNHVIDLNEGQFDGTSAADLTAMFTQIAATPTTTPLVVHFHGGLVDEASGEQIALRLQAVYEAAGAYPVFFVWHAGLLEVLQDHWQSILSDTVFNRLLGLISHFLLSYSSADTSTVGAGTGTGPGLRLDSVQAELGVANAGHVPFAAVDTSGVSFAGLDYTLLRVAVLAEAAIGAVSAALSAASLAPVDVAETAVAVAIRVVERFESGRDHGLYATIVEELVRDWPLGADIQKLWADMKGETASAFSVGDTYGGTAFLKGLMAELTARPGRKVVLVGHSTGAVYICNLLNNLPADWPAAACFEVIFLAAACTYELFASTIAQPAIAARVSSLHAFGMQDEVEQADQVLPPLYLRSLLYFVSGICEPQSDTPIVGMQRFLTLPALNNDPSVSAVRAYLNGQSLVWSVADGAPGCSSHAIHHGDFTTDPTTLASVQYLIGAP